MILPAILAASAIALAVNFNNINEAFKISAVLKEEIRTLEQIKILDKKTETEAFINDKPTEDVPLKINSVLTILPHTEYTPKQLRTIQKIINAQREFIRSNPYSKPNCSDLANIDPTVLTLQECEDIQLLDVKTFGVDKNSNLVTTRIDTNTTASELFMNYSKKKLLPFKRDDEAKAVTISNQNHIITQARTAHVKELAKKAEFAADYKSKISYIEKLGEYEPSIANQKLTNLQRRLTTSQSEIEQNIAVSDEETKASIIDQAVNIVSSDSVNATSDINQIALYSKILISSEQEAEIESLKSRFSAPP